MSVATPPNVGMKWTPVLETALNDAIQKAGGLATAKPKTVYEIMRDGPHREAVAEAVLKPGDPLLPKTVTAKVHKMRQAAKAHPSQPAPQSPPQMSPAGLFSRSVFEDLKSKYNRNVTKRLAKAEPHMLALQAFFVLTDAVDAVAGDGLSQVGVHDSKTLYAYFKNNQVFPDAEIYVRDTPNMESVKAFFGHVIVFLYDQYPEDGPSERHDPGVNYSADKERSFELLLANALQKEDVALPRRRAEFEKAENDHKARIETARRRVDAARKHLQSCGLQASRAKADYAAAAFQCHAASRAISAAEEDLARAEGPDPALQELLDRYGGGWDV
jgi:hypothetical protein